MGNRVTQTRRRWLGTCGVAVGGAVVSGCMGGDEEEPGEDERDENPDPDSWPMHGLDPQNTGHHPTTIGPKDNVEVKWRFEAGDHYRASAIVEDGMVYALCADGYTYAIDATDGDEEWKVETGGSNIPLVAHGIVLSGGSRRSDLYATDSLTGENEWSHDEVVSELVAVDGVAYTTHRTNVVSYDLESGKREYLIEFDSDVIRGTSNSPAIADGKLYVGASEFFKAIDIETGDVIWEAESYEGGSLASGIPTVSDTVVVGDTDGNVYGFDPETGSEVWRRDGPSIQNTRVNSVDGSIYIGSRGGEILEIDSTSGDKIRSIDVGVSVTGEKPAIADGVIYIAAPDEVVAHDLKTGERYWGFASEQQFNNSPVVVDEMVVVTGRDNRLYALEEA